MARSILQPSSQIDARAVFLPVGYKLIGHFATGLKCDSEIKFVEGGFTLETCGDAFYGRKFVQVDDAYQVICGTYIYTIRPPR